MSGGYAIQPTGYVIGSETSAATLTASYADNIENITTKSKGQLQIYIEYTPAENGNYCKLQLERGPSASDFYKFIHIQSTSGTEEWIAKEVEVPKGLTTALGTAYKYAGSIPIADKYIRLSVKEVGVSSVFGTITVRIISSGR